MEYEDLTWAQVRVLGAMHRVNLNRGTPQTEGVSTHQEVLNQNTVWALQRKQVLWWDSHDGTAHLHEASVPLAERCREEVESR